MTVKEVFSSFIRKTTEADYKNSIGFVCNFTPMERPDYVVGVPKAGTLQEIGYNRNR